MGWKDLERPTATSAMSAVTAVGFRQRRLITSISPPLGELGTQIVLPLGTQIVLPAEWICDVYSGFWGRCNVCPLPVGHTHEIPPKEAQLPPLESRLRGRLTRATHKVRRAVHLNCEPFPMRLDKSEVDAVPRAYAPFLGSNRALDLADS